MPKVKPRIMEPRRVLVHQILLAPHQTGGCDSLDPHTMGLVDRRLWQNRHTDPAAIETELRGPKARGWLPARAHDNGPFLVFSNGIGVDDAGQRQSARKVKCQVVEQFG